MEEIYKMTVFICNRMLRHFNLQVYPRFSNEVIYLSYIKLNESSQNTSFYWKSNGKLNANAHATKLDGVKDVNLLMKILHAFKEYGTNITKDEEICVDLSKFMGLTRDSENMEERIKNAILEDLESRLKPIEAVIWTDILPRLQATECDKSA